MKNERGSALLSVLIFATVVAVLSVPLFNSVLQDRVVLEIESEKTQNHYAIESVVEIIKAADKKNMTELSSLVTQLNTTSSKNFINTNTGVPVTVQLDSTNKQLKVETDSGRNAANLEGIFQFVQTDTFANLFVAVNESSRRPDQVIGLTANCNSCETRGIRNQINYFYSDIDKEQFDNIYNKLIDAPSKATESCFETGEFTYTHINCSSGSISGLGYSTSTKLVVNGDVYVSGDFILSGIDEIHIKNNGNLLVGGKIDISNVNKIIVDGHIVARGSIELKNTGGTGITIKTKGIAAGGVGHNGNNVINIHAHSGSSILDDYLNDTGVEEGNFHINNWQVNVK